jgi:hypothetical protein
MLYSEIRSRVSRHVIESYLEVEMGSGTVSGASYKSDQLSLIYLVSYINEDLAAVAVSGRSSVAVVYIYAVTIA